MNLKKMRPGWRKEVTEDGLWQLYLIPISLFLAPPTLLCFLVPWGGAASFATCLYWYGALHWEGSKQWSWLTSKIVDQNMFLTLRGFSPVFGHRMKNSLAYLLYCEQKSGNRLNRISRLSYTHQCLLISPIAYLSMHVTCLMLMVYLSLNLLLQIMINSNQIILIF